MSEAIPMLTRDDITCVEQILFEAMKVSDVQRLQSLLHDDLLFIAPGGQTVTKSMDLDSHRAGTMIISHAEHHIERISLFEESAVSVSLMKASGKVMGQPLSGEFRYIRSWKSFPDGIKVIGGSCTIVG